MTILDTNCDPTFADLFIPANDDSVASLQYILSQFLTAIQLGQKELKNKPNLGQKLDIKKTRFSSVSKKNTLGKTK